MIVKLLSKHHLEFISLKGGYRGSSQSTNVIEITCHGSIIDFSTLFKQDAWMSWRFLDFSRKSFLAFLIHQLHKINTSTDNLCKQFGHRTQAWQNVWPVLDPDRHSDGIYERVFEKFKFEKYQQTTNSWKILQHAKELILIREECSFSDKDWVYFSWVSQCTTLFEWTILSGNFKFCQRKSGKFCPACGKEHLLIIPFPLRET